MAKPGTLPRWASTVTGDATRVKTPTSGKLDVGWAVAERPAGQHANWLLNLICQWLSYLNGLTGEALTWTAAHVFSSTVSFPGGIIGGPTFAASPTSPDYHISTTRHRMFSPAAGSDPTGTGGWLSSGGFTVSTAAGAASWNMAILAEQGETITLTVALLQSVAAAGGQIVLTRTTITGTTSTVATVSIGNINGLQNVSVVTAYAVLPQNSYTLTISFAAGTGTKNIYNADYAFTR